MKTLSLRQPWAWALIHGGKRVENRRWNTKFRGDFLIHASKGCPVHEYRDAVSWMVTRGFVRSELLALDTMSDVALRVAGVDPATLPLVPRLEELARGGVIGRARLVDVLPPSTSGPRAPWHMEEQYGFVLEDVSALPFRPLNGCLGFFDSENIWLRPEAP